MIRPIALALSAFAALAGCVGGPPAVSDAGKLQRIRHVVVIYAENHSFDNLYGLFPGANGISRATPEQMTQLDHDGTPLRELIVFGREGKPDPAFPRMPNRPFRIDAPPVNRPPTAIVPSPIHDYFYNQEQINGGRNNLFAAMSQVGGWTMGHYDGSQFKLWKWAQEYTLADNFFQAAFGGSYLNHQWLICACTPAFPNAPASMRVRLDSSGKLEKKPGSPSANIGAAQIFSSGLGGQATTDGWSVNTTQPPYQPSGVPPAADGPSTHAGEKGGMLGTFNLGLPVPPQTSATIGDRLSAKGVSWAWYSGGWNAALADGMQPAGAPRKVIYNRSAGSPNFQPHHQPFNYFARFAPGTPDRAAHIRDGEDFLGAIGAGTLPAVSFYKPAGRLNQHPSYTDIMTGDTHIAEVLEKLRASPQWQDMLVIVTYDENGGYWDHVPPPSGPGWGDRWGPGTRIPALLIGPHVRRGHIDSTAYDTTSILKFITQRFDLEPLPGVRANMGNLSGALR
ncbi:MAG: acid phosphatase [Burkholderiaceae bacterium]|nr:acid phosphatase [Burkholderiaceae bacterium]